MSVIRPVEAQPPQITAQIVDPKTGRFTPYGHRTVTNLWKRTGGFTDDLDALTGLITLSQTSALASASNEERTRRILGEGLQQVQAQQVERLRSQLEQLKITTEAHFGQMLGGLARPPQTRIITFTANDTWRLNPDVRAIYVALVGGGGGGGQGSSLAGGFGGGGGGGGGFTFAYMAAERLPDEVAVTVGAAGTGATNMGGATAGGYSAFGPYLYANGGNLGGNGGGGAGPAGAVTTTYGNLYQGGPGTAGAFTDASDAVNDYQGAPGGGGGGGSNNGNGGDGAAGAWRAITATGGGGAGGATGATGAAGSTAGDSDVYLAPGYGGGGGGGASTDYGGAGGDGVIGGGGGGGGAVGIVGTDAGNGGNGGAGRVWVVEYY